MFYCKSCSFDCQSLASFRRHLSSSKHVVEEVSNCGNGELDPVTRLWGRNYPAKPEHATAQIAVWWDMEDCPIPEGYDARWVRPRIEGELKKLGYSGPVSITAFGCLKQISDNLLLGLSVAHTIPERIRSRMFSDLLLWRRDNPPPATMMLISNHVEEDFSLGLVDLQQEKKYNLFLAYSLRPYKMSILITSAEWMWDSLLAVSEMRRQVSEMGVLQRCSSSERGLLQKCSSSERGESTGMFYCKSCFCDFKGLDNFRKHLKSEEHKLEEASMYSCIELSERQREQDLKASSIIIDFHKRKVYTTDFS